MSFGNLYIPPEHIPHEIPRTLADPKTSKKTTRVTTERSKEGVNKLGLEAKFKGIGLSFGNESKNFDRLEVTEEKEETRTFDVQPKSSLYVYQRQYKFNVRVWWQLDAWGSNLRVAQYDGRGKHHVSFEVVVDAPEEKSSLEPLSGQTTINIPSVRKEVNDDTAEGHAFGKVPEYPRAIVAGRRKRALGGTDKEVEDEAYKQMPL